MRSMAVCCPQGHGCNAPERGEPCLLDLYERAAGEVPEAGLALARWEDLQRARERGCRRSEWRFRKRAYERACAKATSGLMRNGELGFWWRSLGGVPDPRPPLEGPCEADIAIVGAGYTGLWSAYYLKRAQPSLRVVVLEREFAGYGASARNGGWVAGSLEGPARVYERRGGPAGLLALRRAMFDTVDEVGRVLAAEGIEADQLKSGHLDVALNDAQVARLRARLATARESGIGERDLRAVEAEELRVRLRVAGAQADSQLLGL